MHRLSAPRRRSTSGVPFEALPASVLLPPYTKAQEVVLSGRALVTGQLEVRGMRITVFGMEREHVGTVHAPGERPLSAAGPLVGRTTSVRKGKDRREVARKAAATAAKDVERLSLQVIPEMPQLQVRDAQLFATPLQLWEGERYGPCRRRCEAAARSGPNPRMLQSCQRRLYRFSTFLVLENVGRQPVSHLTLQFEETQPQRRAPPTLEEEFFSGRPTP